MSVVSFFIYECTANAGLKTYVSVNDHEKLAEFESRICEELVRIESWDEQ